MNEVGYVPSNYLEKYLHHPLLSKTFNNLDPTLKQSGIESLYLDVLKQYGERLQHFNSLHKRFCLEREIQQILLWIREANLLNTTFDNRNIDLEQAGKLKSIFEELVTRVIM